MNLVVENSPTKTEAAVGVSVNNAGIARIAGTRMKVSQIALEQERLGRTPEQIVASHPHLSMAQVGAALAFYENHREEVEAQISASLAYADWEQHKAEPSGLTAKLRAKAGQVK